MKWNMFIGALVVSVGLSSQGFSFDLLDRMLGTGGCGCEPACGAKPCCPPKCGRQKSCCPKRSCCKQKKSCCDDHAQSCCKPKRCGHEKSSCNDCCRRDLFAGLRGLLDRCCEPKCCKPEPKCCKPEPKCCNPEPKCCKPKRSCNDCCDNGPLGLGLIHLFRRDCCDSHGCDSCDQCGGSEGAAAAVGDDAPMPPAPEADPSASLRRGRRIASPANFRLNG